MQEPLITLASIARLAQVKRPVVSVWRRRHAGSETPFPAARTRTADGQELFAVDGVVEWLRRTGLGNNPEAALDAVAHSQDIAQNIDAITTLLVLRAAHSDSLLDLDEDDILELAEDLDPTDSFLLSEASAALDPALRHLTDSFVEAAFTPARAVEHLLAMRDRVPGLPDRFSGSLHPRAARLIGHLAASLCVSGAVDRVVESTAGGSDLVTETMRQLPEGIEAGTALAGAASADGSLAGTALSAQPRDPEPSTSTERLARRRVRIHQLTRPELSSDSPTPGGTVHLAHWPGPDDVGRSPAEAIRFVDGISLELGPGDAAVVAGPPTVLNEPLGSEAGAARDALLRSGSVRGIFVLPAGLAPDRPRQALMLWVRIRARGQCARGTSRSLTSPSRA